MDNICNKCNKNFSNKYNLNTHKKTSKSCGQNNNPVYICNYCEKELTTPSGLQKHDKLCINKKLKIEFQELLSGKEKEFQQLLLEKEKECQQLIREKELLSVELRIIKENMEQIVNKGTSVVNNDNKTTINNNQKVEINFFTQEHINKIIKKHFDHNHLIQGAKGVAKFTQEYIAKDGDVLVYKCSDPARQVFYYIDPQSGQKTKDFKGTKLMKILQKPIYDRSSKIIENTEYTIDYLENLDVRTDEDEQQLKFYKFIVDRWIDVSGELLNLDENNFIMELTKLVSV